MSIWLPITEYSLKNKMSISTIRRKIKSNTLKFKVENGKYFIIDEDADYEIGENRFYIRSMDGKGDDKMGFSNIDELVNFAERSISTVSRLNQELVAEKDKVIRMQEGAILQLREQINELKMLVSVLEKNS
jgi:hypothetical protein